jgi:hypothetical protein
MNGETAETNCADAGPNHGPLVNPSITERWPLAAAAKSSANPLHADAAAISEPAPGPA